MLAPLVLGSMTERLLEPLPLAEHQVVSVMVSDSARDPLDSFIDQAFVESIRAELASAAHVPTYDDVRRMTANDTSSWAEAVVKGRQERF